MLSRRPEKVMQVQLLSLPPDNRTGHTLSFLGEVQLGKLDLQLKLEDAQGFGLPGGQLPTYSPQCLIEINKQVDIVRQRCYNSILN